jgi:hypothetical protein
MARTKIGRSCRACQVTFPRTKLRCSYKSCGPCFVCIVPFVPPKMLITLYLLTRSATALQKRVVYHHINNRRIKNIPAHHDPTFSSQTTCRIHCWQASVSPRAFASNVAQKANRRVLPKSGGLSRTNRAPSFLHTSIQRVRVRTSVHNVFFTVLVTTTTTTTARGLMK